MPLKKNQIIPLTIEGISSDGSGVGRARRFLSQGLRPGTCWTPESSRIADGTPSASLKSWLPPRQTESPWTAPPPAPAGGALCGTWTTPPSCGPKKKLWRMRSAGSAGWSCRYSPSCPRRRWTATAIKSSSRWAGTKTAPPALGFTPDAPTGSSPAPTANCSPPS